MQDPLQSISDRCTKTIMANSGVTAEGGWVVWPPRTAQYNGRQNGQKMNMLSEKEMRLLALENVEITEKEYNKT